MSWTAHHRDRSTWPAQVYGRHARGSPKVSFAEKLALYFSPTFYPWNLHLKRYCIAVNWVAGLGLPGILLDFFTTWPERDVSVARNQQNCSLEPKKTGWIHLETAINPQKMRNTICRSRNQKRTFVTLQVRLKSLSLSQVARNHRVKVQKTNTLPFKSYSKDLEVSSNHRNSMNL